MAQHLTARMGVLFLGIALGAGQVCAENLADPTRPADSTAASGTPEGSAEGAPQLIRISRDRKSAMIGGQIVKVGDAYAGGRVVKISESEVVLKSGGAYQTLKLFPGVEKTPSNRKVKR